MAHLSLQVNQLDGGHGEVCSSREGIGVHPAEVALVLRHVRPVRAELYSSSGDPDLRMRTSIELTVTSGQTISDLKIVLGSALFLPDVMK